MIQKIKEFFKGLSKRQRIILTVASVVLIFALVVFLFLYNNGYSGVHNHSKAGEGKIKVACVGDSITYGHGIKNWSKNNYPTQLQDVLGDGYHVQNFGHSGRTVSDFGDQPYTESKQYRLSLEYDADIIVVMMGTNDSKPENWTSAQDFIIEYDSLIDSYRKNNPDVRIILCTPAAAFLDVGSNKSTTNFDVQPRIVETIRNEIRAYALTNSYELVDIYDLTSYHRDWFGDNVHPSADGARSIAENIARKIR